MKTKRYYFILTVLIALLYVPVLGQVELPLPEDNSLIGRANPALAGIKKLYVVVEPVDAKPGKDGLVWGQLQEKVERKLKNAGLKIVPGVYLRQGSKAHDIPELRVTMEMLKFAESQLYVFRVQVSLAAMAYLVEQKLFFKADVWKANPTIQTASVENMPVIVTGVILGQVEAFVHAYLAANPKDAQPGDSNKVSTVPKKWVKPVAKSTTAEYKYVASKNSKVFHKPDCTWAKRISPKNLVGYNSRAQAINAGKRPCKMCKP